VRDDNTVTRLLPAAARNPPPKRGSRHETQRRFDPDDLLLASQQLTEIGRILLRMLHGLNVARNTNPSATPSRHLWKTHKELPILWTTICQHPCYVVGRPDAKIV
jgi:hypothetical protein